MLLKKIQFAFDRIIEKMKWIKIKWNNNKQPTNLKRGSHGWVFSSLYMHLFWNFWMTSKLLKLKPNKNNFSGDPWMFHIMSLEFNFFMLLCLLVVVCYTSMFSHCQLSFYRYVLLCWLHFGWVGIFLSLFMLLSLCCLYAW